jgi:hypothetical protein
VSWQEAREKAIPADCSGLVCLDLGGYDGGMAKVCQQRGALRALCVDNGQYDAYGWHKPKQYEGVEYFDSSLYDWHLPADLVVFSNVIYHQQNPWLALEKVRALTKGTLVLVTSFVPGDLAYWQVYEPYEGHPVSSTVSWRPTVPGLVKLMKNVGFEAAEVGREGDHVVVVGK